MLTMVLPSLSKCTISLILLLNMLANTNMEKLKNSHNSQTEALSFVGSTKQFKGQSGSVAYLECSIMNLGNMSMAWVRMRDRHILSVDRETFISDRR